MAQLLFEKIESIENEDCYNLIFQLFYYMESKHSLELILPHFIIVYPRPRQSD